MGRWARKTDDNHQEIMDAFRACGFSVADTSRLGGGFPDLVVAKHGVNILVEVKDGSKYPSERKLNEKESEFEGAWKGKYMIIEHTHEVQHLHESLFGEDWDCKKHGTGPLTGDY